LRLACRSTGAGVGARAARGKRAAGHGGVAASQPGGRQILAKCWPHTMRKNADLRSAKRPAVLSGNFRLVIIRDHCFKAIRESCKSGPLQQIQVGPNALSAKAVLEARPPQGLSLLPRPDRGRCPTRTGGPASFCGVTEE